ncbi:MAG: hypothetical protein N2651_00670 [Fimbriimonadales bacterium]|nr:hypothetical protein [Fimbriimonadales bacterium]
MAMKRYHGLLGVVVLGALMSASAQVSFTHIKSVDLSTYFPNGGQQGNLASDVAFDGSNLYIAGMSTANSTAESVGVLKISNVLSLDVNSWTYTPLITLTQAGQSRSSYIVYRDGFIYLGTGLGAADDPAQTGIRKFDAATGTQISTWNSSGTVPGVVLPRDLSNSSRAECIETDPGYQGNNPSLAVLARARGIIFRRDFASGAALPNILSIPSRDCLGGQQTTGMRDITFSPEGDAYLRVDNSIFYAQRTAANSVQDGRACRIFNFDSDTQSQVLINIHYLRTSSGDYLIYNRRTGDANNRINKVFVASGSGATWTPYAEILGNEPLPNGSTPAAYAFDIFNFTSGFGPDPSKGDVNLDGIVDDADLLALLFEFGSSNAAVDVNSDGVVDDADLLTVLFNFGSNPRAQYLFIVHSSIDTDRLDIYRVDAGGGE